MLQFFEGVFIQLHPQRRRLHIEHDRDSEEKLPCCGQLVRRKNSENPSFGLFR